MNMNWLEVFKEFAEIAQNVSLIVLGGFLLKTLLGYIFWGWLILTIIKHLRTLLSYIGSNKDLKRIDPPRDELVINEIRDKLNEIVRNQQFYMVGDSRKITNAVHAALVLYTQKNPER